MYLCIPYRIPKPTSLLSLCQIRLLQPSMSGYSAIFLSAKKRGETSVMLRMRTLWARPVRRLHYAYLELFTQLRGSEPVYDQQLD